MVFVQEVIPKTDRKMVLEGGEISLLMRQEFELEESDEGLRVVYQK